MRRRAGSNTWELQLSGQCSRLSASWLLFLTQSDTVLKEEQTISGISLSSSIPSRIEFSIGILPWDRRSGTFCAKVAIAGKDHGVRRDTGSQSLFSKDPNHGKYLPALFWRSLLSKKPTGAGPGIERRVPKSMLKLEAASAPLADRPHSVTGPRGQTCPVRWQDLHVYLYSAPHQLIAARARMQGSSVTNPSVFCSALSLARARALPFAAPPWQPGHSGCCSAGGL